jgi:hypothetical protein
LVVVLAGLQAIEIRDAVNVEQHGFAIQHKGCRTMAERGLGDQR